jgi:inosine/xanthosine triphosphate pyrophosphatase family protein
VTPEEKDAISHRRRAARALANWLERRDAGRASERAG